MQADPNAHSAVAQAIQRGDLPAPGTQTCADCAMCASVYHHEDYAREAWLKVIPLCFKCHRKRHAGPRKNTPSGRFNVRGIEDATARKFKAQAIRRGLTIGEWFTQLTNLHDE